MTKNQPQSDETVIIEPKKAPAQKKPWYREWGEALIFAAVLALIIRTFIIQPFKIPSGSMLDTLKIGDHLMVNKFIYGTKIPFTESRILPVRAPERGDVIVFEWPVDTINDDLMFFQKKDFIKRVVAIPGDTVEVRNKQVFVNGEAVGVPPKGIKPNRFMHTGCSPIGTWKQQAPDRVRDCMEPVEVPENSYFVLGDNRDNSRDSRYWGFVPEANIKGLAFIKYWSWNSDDNSVRWKRIGRLIE